jgi:hypothetical protein
MGKADIQADLMYLCLNNSMFVTAFLSGIVSSHSNAVEH